MSGVRIKRLSPFQILIIANIIFYLMAVYLGSSAFTTKLDFHTNASNFIHQAVAKEMVNETINLSGESREAYAKRFNARVEVQAKSLVILMVPMLALAIFFLFPRQNNPAIGSLVFATHVFTFILMVNTFATPFIVKLGSWIVDIFTLNVSPGLFELIYSVLLAVMIGTYFYLSTKRYFQQSVIFSIIKTMVFIFVVYWVYLIYRMILFFTTFYTL